MIKIHRLMIGESAESLSVQGKFSVFAAELLNGLGNDIGPVGGMVQQAVVFRGKSGIRAEDKTLAAKIFDHFLFQRF